MAKLFTLTVPDVLWINLQVTGAPQSFDYATLEEGTFYQFKSGQNNDIAGQAARFLTGFRRLSPFAAGNEATAFVGCLAYLEMNDHTLKLKDSDAVAWLKGVWAEPSAARSELESKLAVKETHGEHGVPDANAVVEGILDKFTKTVTSLDAVLA